MKDVVIDVLFFYSPKDLEYAFGFHTIEPYYRKEFPNKKGYYIVQKRAINANLKTNSVNDSYSIKWKIHDLKGWTNSSLLNLASSEGLIMDKKHSLDTYKTCMDKALQEEPETFLKYGLDDAEILHKIVASKIENTNTLVSKTLGMPNTYVFDLDSIKYSTGSLVSQILEKYMKHFFIKKLLEEGVDKKDTHHYLRYVYSKMSLVKGQILKKEENLNTWHAIFNHTSFEKIHAYVTEKKLSNFKLFKEDDVLFKLYSYGSIQFFLNQDTISTSKYNALVSGGRCVNEQPTKMKHSNVLDIDMSSCYGTALEDFALPIGIPTIYSTSSHEKGMSLKEFLNMYKITVTGTLRFDQDLIFSKIIDDDKLNTASVAAGKCFENQFSDTPHIHADLVLLRREIINGVITSDVLEAIEKVSSNKELKEFYSLRVVTACMWMKSNKVDSFKDFCTEIFKDEGRFEYSTEFNASLDKRTRKWFSFSLDQFITPLKNQRKAIKNQMKETTDTVLKALLNAVQESVKLVINSTYGILASLFFAVSNAVVADYITARARVNGWYMNKALGTFNTITDGGCFSPELVRFLSVSNKKQNNKTKFAL